MTRPSSAIEPPAARPLTWVPLLAIVCGLLVVYGSLVPFSYRPLSLAAAWERFSDLPYLAIGRGARADWIANILLFVPLAFFWCAWATHGRPSRRMRVLPVLVGCLAFAVVLEFCQLWFAPRTVSRNDILAEWIGSAIGVLIWVFRGPALLRQCAAIAAGGTAGLITGLAVYTGAYVLYVLMPFDFVLSPSELEAAIRRESVMPFISPRCGGAVRCGAKSMIEVASFMPIGFLLALIARNRRQPLPRPLIGAAIGAIAALVIEGSQVLIVSAVSQWLSVVTRAIGMAAGVYLGRSWNAPTLARLLRIGPALFLAGGLGYVLSVGVAVWRGRWRLDGALERLDAVNWLPFFYHYWTTEQGAIVSVVFNAVFYAPVGAAFWLWRFRESGGHRTDFPGAGRAAATAILLALAVEGSRLLKASGHPDPTNILIAAAAAVLAFRGLGWFAACLLPDASSRPTFRRPARQATR